MFIDMAAPVDAGAALAALQAAVARMCRLREALALGLDAPSRAALEARRRFPGALRIRGVVLPARPNVAATREREEL